MNKEEIKQRIMDLYDAAFNNAQKITKNTSNYIMEFQTFVPEKIKYSSYPMSDVIEAFGMHNPSIYAKGNLKEINPRETSKTFIKYCYDGSNKLAYYFKVKNKVIDETFYKVIYDKDKMYAIEVNGKQCSQEDNKPKYVIIATFKDDKIIKIEEIYLSTLSYRSEIYDYENDDLKSVTLIRLGQYNALRVYNVPFTANKFLSKKAETLYLDFLEESDFYSRGFSSIVSIEDYRRILDDKVPNHL